METDPVNHMLGVISVEGRPGLFWFHISGEDQREQIPLFLYPHLMQYPVLLSDLLHHSPSFSSSDCLFPGFLGNWVEGTTHLSGLFCYSQHLGLTICDINNVKVMTRWTLAIPNA